MELKLSDRIVDETGEYEAGMKAISESASPSYKALALSRRDSSADPIEIECWLSA